MILGIIFIFLPLAVFGLVGLLRPGLASNLALLASVALILALWASYYVGAGVFIGDPRADSIALAMTWLLTIALILGAGVQFWRRHARGSSRFTGLLLGAAVIAVGLPALFTLAI